MEQIKQLRLVAQRYSWLMAMYFFSSCTQAFPMVSVGSILNTEFKAAPSEITLYYSLIFLPWNFRAIYGLVSDSLPIFGYRRKLYILASYTLVSVCYIIYGQIVSTLSQALIVGILMNIFFSFSEAVLDAISVEQIRHNGLDESEDSRIKASCDIQSANMTFRTLGSFVSVFIAGGLSTHISPRTIITITCVFPILSGITYSLIPEPSFTESVSVFPKTKLLFKYLNACIRSRRWPIELFATVKPVLLPSVFILLYASCPSSGIMFTNYLYTYLNFSQFEFHLISQCGNIGSLLGTLIYWKAFRTVKDMRWVFGVSVFIAILASCSRLLITNGDLFVLMKRLLISQCASRSCRFKFMHASRQVARKTSCLKVLSLDCLLPLKIGVVRFRDAYLVH